MREYGLSFLFTSRWAPSADPPVLGPIYGTMVTSVIAMMIAIPVGLGIAIFLTELCPQWLRDQAAWSCSPGRPLDHLRHVGFFVLRRSWPTAFQPFMIRLFDGVPVLGTIFAGPPSYLSLFNAALILAIMVLPFIVAISVDVFETVPAVLKEKLDLRHGLHHLGSRSQRGHALYPGRRDRRHHAGARPRSAKPWR